MAGQTPYDESFYRAQKDGSYRSAELTIPKLLNYVPKPKSVVDVGCGLIIYPAGMTRSKSI